MKNVLAGVAGGLIMCCLVSDIQAAEAQNDYVKVSADTPVYRLEQKGDTDFDAYCGGSGPATFKVVKMGNWELVAPASGSVTIAPGGTGGWEVKSQLCEDKRNGTIYLWNYFIKADEYNAKNITVPFGKTAIYRSYEGENTANSDWSVNGYEESGKKYNTDSIIFSRSFWDITEWFTESYPTPQPGVYEIKANLTGNPSVTDAGVMTVVGAEFTENESHPYGFDDYSNWSLGPADYYKVGTERKGHCTLPYASVEEGHEGMVYLSVDPDLNTKAIPITSSASALALNPETTLTTTDVAFTPSSGWFPETATVTAKMDDTTLAKLDVISYDLRQYKCLLVRVSSDGGHTWPPVPASCYKYNSVFKQAVLGFTTTSFLYTYNFPSDSKWRISELQDLAGSFTRDNPELSENFDFLVFIIEGYDENDDKVCGRGETKGYYSWIYAELAAKTYLAPHELGHNFGLADQYTKLGEITELGPDKDNVMNDSYSWKLRRDQWVTIRENHIKGD